jgi:predicted DNA-binding ribbon-helix-helix protein
MKSLVVKRSIVIAGHKTSVSLEDAFWNALKEIAGERDATLSDLVASIDTARELGNLSSAIRLFVLTYRSQLEDGETGAEAELGRVLHETQRSRLERVGSRMRETGVKRPGGSTNLRTRVSPTNTRLLNRA